MLLTYIYIYYIYIYIYIDIVLDVLDTSGESKNNIGPPSGGPKLGDIHKSAAVGTYPYIHMYSQDVYQL